MMEDLWRFDLTTRGFIVDVDSLADITPSTIPPLDAIERRDKSTIIVVQNVDSEWQARLISQLDINQSFFDRHNERSPEAPVPWSAVFGPTSEAQRRPFAASELEVKLRETGYHEDGFTRSCWHVDAILELDRVRPNVLRPAKDMAAPSGRQAIFDPNFGWQASTRISLLHVSRLLSIFLVDGGPKMEQSNREVPLSRARLYVPVTTSRSGLVIPRIHGTPIFSIAHSLGMFLSHAWHITMFEGNTLSAEETMYLLAVSCWKSNIATQRSEIQRIAFERIPARPDSSLNTELHLQREQLTDLIREVEEMPKWMPEYLSSGLAQRKNGYIGYPDQVCRQILDEARELNKFLMDTFQLLMSTVSVIAAENALTETRSAQKLLWLASVYLPLTLVTSIFGMNISFINDSPAPWWSCLVALVATVVFTVGTLEIFAAFGESGRARGWQSVTQARTGMFVGRRQSRDPFEGV